MTPQTLSTIRDMARVQEAPVIATAIGWDMERLRRVAKAHAIELMGGDFVPPLMEHDETAAARAWNLKCSEPAPAPVHNSVDEIMALLSTRQAEIVRFLLARLDDDFVSGTAIANAIGISAEGFSERVQAIRLKFEVNSVNWKIESRRAGGSGGYRLVTDGDGS